MIEVILGMGLLGTTAASAAFVLGRQKGREASSAEHAIDATTLGGQRDAAERRARELQAELGRYRGMSLAGSVLSAEPHFANRLAAVEAEEVVGLVRGLSMVDDVVVADRAGFALTRSGGEGGADLAPIAASSAAMMRRVALSTIPVVQLAYETFSAEHVCVRALPGRADGTLLLVKTSSQPVSPLVVDAAAHACARSATEVVSGAPALAMRGTTEVRHVDEPTFGEVFAQISRELRDDLKGLVLTLDGRPVFASVRNGPDERIRNLLALELAALQAKVTFHLRTMAMARVQATLRDHSSVTWAALAPRSRLAVLAFGPLDSRAAERLAGRLRRATGERSLVQLQGAA